MSRTIASVPSIVSPVQNRARTASFFLICLRQLFALLTRTYRPREPELADLDDRLLNDIGLSRSTYPEPLRHGLVDPWHYG
jgi:uncharacterized protein YjiS (DUF1127 family)